MFRALLWVMLAFLAAGSLGGCAIPRTIALNNKADEPVFHPPGSREIQRQINGWGGEERFYLSVDCAGGQEEIAMWIVQPFEQQGWSVKTRGKRNPERIAPVLDVYMERFVHIGGSACLETLSLSISDTGEGKERRSIDISYHVRHPWDEPLSAARSAVKLPFFLVLGPILGYTMGESVVTLIEVSSSPLWGWW